MLLIPVAEFPVSESFGKKRRGYCSKAELDILEHDFQRGGARSSKNEEKASAVLMERVKIGAKANNECRENGCHGVTETRKFSCDEREGYGHYRK